MSVIQWADSKHDLTALDHDEIKSRLVRQIRDRALEIYVFGSFATADVTFESDIDLVIIKETTENFVQRPLEFVDLFDIFPRLDILVYTPEEFKRMLARDDGFFKGATLQRILPEEPNAVP